MVPQAITPKRHQIFGIAPANAARAVAHVATCQIALSRQEGGRGLRGCRWLGHWAGFAECAVAVQGECEKLGMPVRLVVLPERHKLVDWVTPLMLAVLQSISIHDKYAWVDRVLKELSP